LENVSQILFLLNFAKLTDKKTVDMGEKLFSLLLFTFDLFIGLFAELQHDFSLALVG
jgi:hypothetical protein